MPANAEVVENFAWKLERICILDSLKDYKTLGECQRLTEKYEALDNDDKT